VKRRVGLHALVGGLLLLVLGSHVSAAPTDTELNFTVAGDFASTSNTNAVLDTVRNLNSDLTLAVGDLSYGTTGQEASWCDYVTSHVGAGYPFELLSGNHESNGQNGNINDFSSCLPNQLPGVIGTYGKQYYVDVPATDPLVRFIMVSPSLTFPEGTYNYSAGSARYQWTAQTIDSARARSIPWVVVGMHKPCITVGTYSCDIGADLFNLLLSKKVDLILSGHDHTYQRSKQLALSASCTALAPGSYDPDCVVDSDSTLSAAAGALSVVVGTGGVGPLYNVSASDPEAGYFAKFSGANLDPTWGILDVTVTSESLEGSFARASGGTLADSFSITRDPTPPNQPPVASFTANCTDLSCDFDGSASSDPDGTIVSHDWDFGDGTTATGPTPPAHTYAAAGTYSVRLTVTDNGGVADSLTKSVSVTAPPETLFVSDQFSRAIAVGLGSAPIGGTYTYGGSTSNFSVADGFGNVRVAAGSGPSAYLATPTAPSSDLRLVFGLDKLPTGSGLYESAFARRVSNQGAYFAKARVTSTGAVTLELDRKTSTGSDVVLSTASTISGLTYGVGDQLILRVQAVGASPTTIRAKVWKAGTAEPSSWQSTVTDNTSGLQTGGSFGVSAYLSSAANNGPLTVKMDELSVGAP
jgi:PKD repeat protein